MTSTGNGEVTLARTITEDFSGTALPSGWGTRATPWNGGGTISVSGGSINVDGHRANTSASFGPGRTLEFRATFGAGTFQNAGFGQDLEAVGETWIVFGTNGTTNTLFARVNTGGGSVDTNLGIGLVGTPHVYRIEWAGNAVRFYVDGALVDTRATAIAVQLRPVISDFNTGGGNLSVDWLHMTPYASSGTFTSRVFDAGQVAAWQHLAADVITPVGTGIELRVPHRRRRCPWRRLDRVDAGPRERSCSDQDARYLQYRASLTTTNTEVTPILREVEFTLGAPNRAPSLAAIGNQSVAEGATALVLALSASDADLDELTFSLDAACPGLGQPGAAASLSLSPGFDDAGAAQPDRHRQRRPAQ